MIYKKILSNHHAFNRFNQKCKEKSDVFALHNNNESKKDFWKVESSLYQCFHFETSWLKCRSLHEDQSRSWRYA